MPIISTYPDKPHKEQQHIIGEEHTDRLGDLWDYVEFTPGTYKEGLLVRDQQQADFVANGSGTVTAAAAVGTNVLQDTGEFANKDLRGAIGVIDSGGGIGQIFQVRSHDTNELQIVVHGSEENNRGWETALTTSSTYNLTIPGRVEIASASINDVRGVVQYKDPFTVPSGELWYGYVRRTGIGPALCDNTGTTNPIRNNRFVTPAASGLVQGVPSTLTVAALSYVIGRAISVNPTGADSLIPVNFNIPNGGRSYRRPRKREEPKLTVE